MPIVNLPKLTLVIANDADKKLIYQIRHTIYADELNQHNPTENQQLTDQLDKENFYIVAKFQNQLVGFISITTPNSPKFSVDKYFLRTDIPFVFDDYLYEIRLLSVIKEKRSAPIALSLMYAAYRWVQSHGGKHIVAICREDLIQMYQKAGLEPLPHKAVSGKVTYILSVAKTESLAQKVAANKPFYEKLFSKLNWQLPYLFFTPSPCYHGGSFFKAIGENLQQLEKAKDIINADVLDAWFEPSPKVLEVIKAQLPFLLQTSPPTHAEGLINAISMNRSIKPNCILPGAGSSDLIFLAFTHLLSKQSSVLIIDPCYGEYIHVLEKVVQCSVIKFNLQLQEGFIINTEALLKEIKKGYDLVVLVNPNSPTGVYCPKREMQEMLLKVPLQTLVWIDETYIEYVGNTESLEQFASKTENIMICKSMSKVYALSGARAAYLCCPPHLIELLQQYAPPWSVSLPAQAAAIAALQDSAYYLAKYAETTQLRNELKEGLKQLGITKFVEGVANFILFYLPVQTKTTAELINTCKNQQLFLRDVSNMGDNIGQNAIRIAVKDQATNRRMLAIIKKALQ